jgi:protein-L-isoaspartate(D-aspartate) O-methyltransferase
MVEDQLKARGISDSRVLDAMRRVPRHLFIPDTQWARAYGDHPVGISCDQTISQPYMVALMTQCLAIGGWESVLEIGTGSGYQTAILAELAQEVYTVERFAELSEKSRIPLGKQGYRNIHFRIGDGTLGWPERGPFDRIIVTAGAPRVPDSLKAQLADGGILVIPVGPGDGQNLLVIRKTAGRFDETSACACIFVKLVGKEGWPENSPREGSSGSSWWW